MKLQRAEEHFGQLNHEHAAFLSRNPYRMLVEDDPEREGHSFLWRAKIVEYPPLEKWSSLIGECVHALRSALDHTAYALVNRDKFVSEDRPAFPLLDNADSWKSVHPDKLPGVPPEALALIERVQPYNRTAVGDILRNVNELDIRDKHRRLNLVNATVEGTSWGAVGAEIEIEEADSGIGPFVDGAVVGRWRLVPDVPDQKMHMQTNFEFGITMGEGEPCAGLPVVTMLERYRAVVGAVVTSFAKYL
jgi:hypothetical protein